MTREADRPRRLRRYLIILAIVVVPLVLLILATRPPGITPGSVLVVHLEGELAEGPSQNPLQLLQHTLSQAEGPASLHDLRRALRHVKKDGRVAGVILEIHSLGAGWAQVEEMRDLIGELRAAGKPVQALLCGDMVEEKEYSLAVSTGRVVVSPETGLLLNGLAAEVTFYRGVLDKLQVEPQFIQFKEYKSAAEPFINRQMSPAMREWVTAVLSEVYEGFLTQVTQARQLDRSDLQRKMSRGLLTTKDALAAHLIDAVGYRDEVVEALKGPAPETRKLSQRMLSTGRYLKALGSEPRYGEVALIYAVGPITSGGGQGGALSGEVIEGMKTAKAIREAAEDDQIKAIVMRVNSPGGSAVGSDFVWREITRARQKKPVVVSMSTVAGSGGYWISMGADAIVAQPTTLTGSIGVVFGHFDVLPLWKWAGGTVDKVKFGDNADLLSPFHRLTEEQLGIVTSWMQQVYDDFVARVAQGRKMTFDQAEPLAHGRVWSGAQAKQRKLVDELGGLGVALRLARERAGLSANPDAEPVVYPKQQGLLGVVAQLGASVKGGSGAQEVLHELRDLAVELGTPRPYLIAPTVAIH